MTRYFIAGNAWLFAAVMLYIGKCSERAAPDRYSVFGTGRWFSPSEYTALNLCVLAIAIGFFVIAAKTRITPLSPASTPQT